MRFFRLLKKFIRQSIIPLTVLLGLVFCIPQTSYAAYVNPTNQNNIVVLPKTQTIAGDYFTYGHEVTIDGTVDGDVYAAGGTIVINGTVYGDVLAVGGVVQVQGKVLGNIRVLAGSVVVDGTVGRNVSVVGRSITVADTASLSGNLTAVGKEVYVSGPVAWDMHLIGSRITLTSSVGRNVLAYDGQFIVASTAVIKGDFSYFSKNIAQIDQGAKITGKVTHTLLQQPVHEQAMQQQLIKVAVVGRFIGFLSTLLLGFLFLHFLPVYTKKITIIMEKHMWKSMGVGLLGLVGIPVIAILFIVTLLGLPIGVLFFVAYFVFLYVAKLITVTFIGETLLTFIKATSNKYVIFTVGLLAYTILAIIPIVSFLLHLLVLAGFGALLWEEKIFYKQLRKRDSI